MALFDFLKNPSSDSPRVDEHAANPGATSAPAPSSLGTVATAQVAEARERSLNLSAESTKRRGRPPKGDSRNSGTDSANLQARLDAEIRSQLEQVHDPKAWGALLAAPGDVALTITGREHWNIKENERATLGACGSAAARTLMVTNPQALAMLMLAAGLFSVYVPRLTLEMKHQREEAKKAKDAKQPASA